MKLPEDKRHIFKEPFGELFKDSASAFEYLDSIDYEKLITVGDVVSATFLKNGYEPDMVIADFTTERTPAKKEDIEKIKNYSIDTVEIENPAGKITDELWNTIEDADDPLKIIVNGEEDLATLPATIFPPEGTIVAYGQPGEGIVLIEVDEEKKEEFEEYIDLFEEE